MSCQASLVFLVAPSLHIHKASSDWLKFIGYKFVFDAFVAEVGNEEGKTFIEPEVIPPFHGDQVSKPVMGNLMGDSICEIVHFWGRHFFFVEKEIIEDY